MLVYRYILLHTILVRISVVVNISMHSDIVLCP